MGQTCFFITGTLSELQAMAGGSGEGYAEGFTAPGLKMLGGSRVSVSGFRG